MNKRRQNSLVPKLRVLFTLLFSVVFISALKAQDYVINTSETWASDQVWSTNVVIGSGGTLTINAGVRVSINFADVNGDNVGDFRLEVKDGGKLIINGTPANPVIFEGGGSTPPSGAGYSKWWQGLTVGGAGTSSIKFLKVRNANNAFSINNATNLVGCIADSCFNGITVANTTGTVELAGPTLTNLLGKGIIVNNGVTNIKSANISNITDNGIEVNAPGTLIDWAVITNAGTGIYNSANATSTIVKNSSVTGNKKSGLFNLDGTVTLTNCVFNSNTFNGVVNSSGTLTMSLCDLSNNTSRGFVAAGNGVSTVKSVTDTANGNVGAEIYPSKLATDVVVLAGTAETPMPTVYFQYSNIYSNSKSTTPANIQVRSTATVATPAADFTANWWGTSSGILNLVTMQTASSVNYINWRIIGVYAVDAFANLSIAKSITISYPVANQSLVANENCTVAWQTTGNIPYLVVSNNDGALQTYAVVPNSGTYTFVPTTVAANTITVHSYAADSAALTKSVTVTVGAAATMFVNNPATTDTLKAGKKFTVKWTVPSTVKLVKIYYCPAGTIAGAGTSILAPSVDATLGSYEVTVPVDVKYAAVPAAKVALRDVTVGVTPVADALSSTFQTAASAPWAFTPHGNSMTIAVDTLVFLDKDGIVDVKTENSDSYLGAFWTNPSGQSVCVGYVGGVEATPAAAAVTAHAAAPAPRAATYTVLTAAGIVAAGLKDGDLVNINGSAVAAFNGLQVVSSVTATTFEIKVADGVGVFAGVTWKVTRGYRVLTVWGDDPTTSDIEGPKDGDAIGFKMYQAGYTPATNPDGVLTARISPAKGAGGAGTHTEIHTGAAGDSALTVTYTANDYKSYNAMFTREGFGSSSSSTGTLSRTVTETVGGLWYLFSTFVAPSSGSKITDFVSEIMTPALAADHVEIAKNGLGEVYWPSLKINQIDAHKGWTYPEAYFIKILGAGPTLNFTITNGNIITPETSPINLAEGWNYVAYLRSSNMNISTALSSITPFISIVKQDDGKVFWPTYSINEIGTMKPGYGYMIKVNQACVLTYPSNSYTGKVVATEEAKNTSHFVVNLNSDNSATIAILSDALNGKLMTNDEIGVFNSKGVLVGSCVYSGGNVAVTAWGLESGAKEGFGMNSGEAYTIKVWSKATGKETILAGLSFTQGSGLYSNNGVSVISKVEGLKNVIPTEFAVSQNYPNPFNPSTIINYALPSDAKVRIAVYNALGQQVAEVMNTDMKAGYHQVTFNAAGLASGIYFYKIDAGNFHQAKKMNLLK